MELGSLTKINVRDVWKDEAKDFTPWLAQEDNIRILSKEIGIELEVSSIEKEVGSFRADILCNDINSESFVVIENQLEKTDHNHLGQLLTYAAGLKALTIVWIAKEFTEEHRAVIDWLNEITDENYNFFGIEIQAWKIGDSLPAPKFSLVCKPNTWMKKVTETKLTDFDQFRFEYWEAFKKFLEEQEGNCLLMGKPRSGGSVSFSTGRSGFKLRTVVSSWDDAKQAYSGGEIRVELIVEAGDSEDNRKYLLQLKEKTLAEFSGCEEELTWLLDSSNTKRSRVYIRKSVDLYNRTEQESQFSWLLKNLELFDKVFRPVIKEL